MCCIDEDGQGGMCASVLGGLAVKLSLVSRTQIDAASGKDMKYVSDAAARLLKILLVTVQPL